MGHGIPQYGPRRLDEIALPVSLRAIERGDLLETGCEQQGSQRDCSEAISSLDELSSAATWPARPRLGHHGRLIVDLTDQAPRHRQALEQRSLPCTLFAHWRLQQAPVGGLTGIIARFRTQRALTEATAIGDPRTISSAPQATQPKRP